MKYQVSKHVSKWYLYQRLTNAAHNNGLHTTTEQEAKLSLG